MLNILVVGAGIGGLSAARALTLDGHRVTVAERAAGSTAIGAGLLLQPGAVRDLALLGVDAGAVSFPLRALRITGPAGRRLASVPSRRGGRRLGCARADLHAALLATVEDRADLRWGAAVTSVAETPAAVTCTLGGAEESFDLVIGADGLRSTVRTLIRHDVPLRYAGVTCWRAMVDVGCGVDGVESWQGAERWGVIPVGPARSYVFATLAAAAGSTGPGWPLGRFRSDPADPAAAALDAAALAPAGQVLHHDLYELSRTDWGTERVLLVGDAAHAMTPNLGEGAAAAIADARAAASALSPGIAGARNRYRARRRARVELVRAGSRVTGTVAHLRSPALRAIRDAGMRWAPIPAPR